MRTFIVLALCVVCSACGLPDLPSFGDPNTTFCTLEARTSVLVTVVGPMGTIVDEAHVTFTVNGGPEQVAECLFSSNTPAKGCTRWMAGRETSGEFTLTATSADGQHTEQLQVSVSGDSCHVITKEVTITLPVSK
jgi:hypothetical protein